uniref:Uncharacterized protein n=1 Tax=Klebsiella pneumoniae TaxID=573 RepID=A0A7D5KMR5_KLEPN|nr:hypothetical protein [Klebsiella pneumoniae]
MFRLRSTEDVIIFRKKTPAMKTSRRITNALQIYMMWSLKREQTSRCDRESIPPLQDVGKYRQASVHVYQET